MATTLTDTEIAELQRKAHAFDSEQGRLRKTQEELDAERTKRAELEANLGRAQLPQLDARAAEIFGADGVTALQNMFGPVLGKLDSIGKKFEERDTAEAQVQAAKTYLKALDGKLSGNSLPGFVNRLYDGDLSAPWAAFAESHPVIRRAQEAGDVETVSDMVNVFIHQNKEIVSGGGFSPHAVGGHSLTVKSDFSDADYMRDAAILKKQMADCVITEQDYTQKTDALYGRWVAAQEKVEQSASAFGLV